ncbi:unnamed protein product [Mycena citricolor]|uniref:NAD-dependent epimerase/dehydratase domain-containing protein n=1 Tax=Mycena citricolor TaxID=2018698 RepID=A0AAD2HWR0_9AGAR|nr:unnamed protein product [Mycena citricolor]
MWLGPGLRARCGRLVTKLGRSSGGYNSWTRTRKILSTSIILPQRAHYTMPDKLIFVTGASGFLGSHVVLQLLEKGYRVRAAARGVKVDLLRERYASHASQFEAVAIQDLVHDTFPAALAGVDALVHLASPLAGREAPAQILQTAEEGTMNVVRQAEKAGIKRIVVTCSIASVLNPENKLTDKDWNPVTRELALASDAPPLLTYSASKKFAELALWDWAEKHPEVDVTTLNPTFFFGPFTPEFRIPEPDTAMLSTNDYVYQFIQPRGQLMSPMSYFVDVRDVAKAHVQALVSPPSSEVGRKRILLSSPHGKTWAQILEYIAENRPALKDRLMTVPPTPSTKGAMPMDWERVEQVLGMKVGDFHTLDETVLGAIDALLELEDRWRGAGYEYSASSGWGPRV